MIPRNYLHEKPSRRNCRRLRRVCYSRHHGRPPKQVAEFLTKNSLLVPTDEEWIVLYLALEDKPIPTASPLLTPILVVQNRVPFERINSCDSRIGIVLLLSNAGMVLSAHVIVDMDDRNFRHSGSCASISTLSYCIT